MADSVSEEIINKNNNKDQADAACSKPKHNNNNSIDNDQNRHVPNDSPMPNGSDDQQQNVANELGEEFDVGDQAEDEDDDIDDEANANDDDEDNYDDYYTNTEFDFAESCEQQCDLQQDPEYFDYKVVNKNQLLEHLEQMVEQLAQRLNMNKSVAKIVLLYHKWDVEEIVALHQNDPKQLLSNGRLISLIGPAHHVCPKGACDVCFQPDVLKQALNCEHSFCVECWQSHVQTQVQTGSALRIECMGHQCPLLVPADLAEWLLQGNSDAIRQYKHFALVECVQTNARVQQCPGVDCDYFFLAKQHPLSKRVQCTSCTTCCCFRCQLDYHAPTDCATIRKWMTKCADDSETANYISANTKDCPECHVCIEKNGGCNHMQCTGCKYEFCWICMGSWKGHAGHYYDCSRFKEKPGSKDTEQSNPINEARKALQKYLFYYERWDNHARSLKLEQQTLEKIKERIHEIVMKENSSVTTWIDWQYLLDAAALLAKCRYTLQYTYPYAYYMELGPRKELFEYQQAQLEAEIEDLSWKVERSETYDRAEIENQMDVAEKRRTTLLKDFLPI